MNQLKSKTSGTKRPVFNERTVHHPSQQPSQPIAKGSVIKKTIIWSAAGLMILLLITGYLYYRRPLPYYRKPVNVNLELAANFGEVRSGHFHMGLDIRTKGRENMPIYAIAEGFVSRVQVTEHGYGKALFIDHPNGTTSVYAHLNNFDARVEQYIHKKQYRDEQWQQDVVFDTHFFPVKKGELIGYSGNTGDSKGPHLHFEIRDSKTGNNLNPLLSGFELADEMPPVVKALYWYDRGTSIYETTARHIAVKTLEAQYTTVDKIIKVNTPRISLGIEAIDKMTGNRFKLGIYKAGLYVDDSFIHTFTMHDFSVAESRYVNACIDYKEWVRSKKSIQLLSTLPGNHIPIFKRSPADGIIDLGDRKLHTVRIIINDLSGNTATVNFRVRYALSKPDRREKTGSKKLLPGLENKVVSDNAAVQFSRYAFYDAVPFTITEEYNPGAGKASVLVRLYDSVVPVHDSFTVQVRTTLPVNDPLRRRTVMQLISETGNTVSKVSWKGNRAAAVFDRLGTVQLLTDTIAPVITTALPENKSATTDQSGFRLLCKDNLGEVAFFRAELNGQWLKFEKRGNVYSYFFDEYCGSGLHTLQVTARDVAGNSSTRVFSITRP